MAKRTTIKNIMRLASKSRHASAVRAADAALLEQYMDDITRGWWRNVKLEDLN